MLKKIVLGLFFGCVAMVSYADETINLKYAEAFEKSKNEGKPLVVLISAKWCPHCVTMKSETVEPMKKDGSLKDAIVTIVDVDDEPELVKSLYIINEKTKEKITSIPQIMVFTPPQQQEPKKYGLVGRQGQTRVLELLKKVLNK